jgi:hypothetical protein
MTTRGTNFRHDRLQRRYLLACDQIRQHSCSPVASFAECFDRSPDALRQRWRKAALRLLALGSYVRWLREHDYPEDYIDNWRRRERAKQQGVERNSRARKRPLIPYVGFDPKERDLNIGANHVYQ